MRVGASSKMIDFIDLLFATIAIIAAGGSIASGQPANVLITLVVFVVVAFLAGSKQVKYRNLSVTLGAFVIGLLVATFIVPAALRVSPGLARPEVINLVVKGTWAIVLAWSLVPFGRMLRDMNYGLGRITAGAALAGLAAAAVYAAWYAFYYQGPGLPFRNALPSAQALLPAVIVFALGNAFFEEVIFRGVVMKTLEEFTGRTTVAVLLQALLYALAGISATAVPAGWAGLASNFMIALFLGWTVLRTRGLVLAMAVHFLLSLALAIIH